MYIVYVNIFLLYSDVIFYYQILNTLFFARIKRKLLQRSKDFLFLSLIHLVFDVVIDLTSREANGKKCTMIL